MGTTLLLEDGITFLNHGAFGATLKSCLDSKRQWAEYIERQPVRFFDRALVAECQEFSVVRLERCTITFLVDMVRKVGR